MLVDKNCSNCGDSIKWFEFKIKDGILCNKCYAKFNHSYKFNRTLADIISRHEIYIRNKVETKIINENNFSFSLPNKNGIKVDALNKNIYLLKPSTNFIKILKQQHEEIVLNYNQLLSSEIFQDGSSVIKTNRTSQIGGALLGNILIGPIGLLIGGLTGSKTQANKVHKIDLRIVVNDIKNPTHIINFLDSETNISSFTYKNAIEKARKWQDLLSVIIKTADEEDTKLINPSNVNPIKNFSIPDELTKLAELKTKGFINEVEFENLKNQILKELK